MDRPSAPRVTAEPAKAGVVNPIQLWATFANNVFVLQRKSWANLAAAQRPDDN